MIAWHALQSWQTDWYASQCVTAWPDTSSRLRALHNTYVHTYTHTHTRMHTHTHARTHVHTFGRMSVGLGCSRPDVQAHVPRFNCDSIGPEGVYPYCVWVVSRDDYPHAHRIYRHSHSAPAPAPATRHTPHVHSHCRPRVLASQSGMVNVRDEDATPESVVAELTDAQRQVLPALVTHHLPLTRLTRYLSSTGDFGDER